MSDNSQSTAVSPRPSLDQASLSQTEKDLPLGMEMIEIKEGPLHVPEHGEGTGEQFSEMLKHMNQATGHDEEGMLEKTIVVDRGRGDEKVVLVDWEEKDPEVSLSLGMWLTTESPQHLRGQEGAPGRHTRRLYGSDRHQRNMHGRDGALRRAILPHDEYRFRLILLYAPVPDRDHASCPCSVV